MIKDMIFVLLIILASQIFSLLLYIVFQKQRVIYVYVNVVWLKNLIVFLGFAIVTYNQGVVWKANDDFCKRNGVQQREWVNKHADESIRPLINTCIFGANNHNLNTNLGIKTQQYNLIQMQNTISSFPTNALNVNTDGITSYDKNVLKYYIQNPWDI